MIGVVIPAHNEEEHLAFALAGARRAARHPGLKGEPVMVVVVLDACTDVSEEIVDLFGFAKVHTQARCVGLARAAGADHLLARGARWLAFSDADSVVSEDWLAAQLSLNAEVVCGTVQVGDWSLVGNGVRSRYEAAYVDSEGHRHIHGANLGMTAASYRKVGGFRALARGEDVALVQDLHLSGARISWSAMPRVVTSARLAGRAAGGFAGYLRRLSGLDQIGGEVRLLTHAADAAGPPACTPAA